jgi:hypothetical protein
MTISLIIDHFPPTRPGVFARDQVALFVLLLSSQRRFCGLDRGVRLNDHKFCLANRAEEEGVGTFSA